MISAIFRFVRSISNSQTIYTIEFVAFAIVCLFTYLGRVVITGTGELFGKTYGKKNYFAACLKTIFTILGFVGIVLLMLFWVMDFIAHFFHRSIWYIIISTVMAALWIMLFFKGSAQEIENKSIVEEKNSKQVDQILAENPIFTRAIAIVNNNPQIKTIRVYRDGIAFYFREIRSNLKNKPHITGKTQKDVDREIAGALQQWLADEGTVRRANADIVLNYRDFEFSSASVKTMEDFARHLCRKLSPSFRFSFDKHEWVIEHKERIIYDLGYSLSGSGTLKHDYETKDIDARDSAVAYFELYVLNPKDAVNKVEEKPKTEIKHYW